MNSGWRLLTVGDVVAPVKKCSCGVTRSVQTSSLLITWARGSFFEWYR